MYARTGLDPGQVMAQHATIEDDCGACHAEVEHPGLVWAADVAGAGLFGTERELANADRCLSCHAFGESALAAHGTATPGLARAANLGVGRTEWSSQRGGELGSDLIAAFVGDRLRSPNAFTAPPAQLACVACHREHEGRSFDATTMTDAECQACHAEPFRGFAEHPPLVDYPHRQEGQVAFDHRTHFGQHFPESARSGTPPPASCADCHAPTPTGAMPVTGFDACAACHEADIIDPPGGAEYIEFLAPPGLDLEALADAGIGDWPYVVEAEPNAFLALLIEAGGYLDDGDAARIADLDLMDLIDAPEDERRAVARFAWAVKTLMRDLVQDGPGELVDTMLDPAADQGASASADLAAALPFAVVDGAAGWWFPELETDVERHEAGEVVPTREVEPDYENLAEPWDIDEWLRLGGWRFEEAALVYRPSGHADRFMRAWLTLAAARPDSGRELLALLAADDAPGDCGRCHVTGAESAMRLNWFARGRPAVALGPHASPVLGYRTEPAVRHLKPFSHLTHRQSVAENGCVACHQIAEDGAAAHSAAGFAPLGEGACVACHRAATEVGDCLTCHTYHFERADAVLMRAGGTMAALEPTMD